MNKQDLIRRFLPKVPLVVKTSVEVSLISNPSISIDSTFSCIKTRRTEELNWKSLSCTRRPDSEPTIRGTEPSEKLTIELLVEIEGQLSLSRIIETVSKSGTLDCTLSLTVISIFLVSPRGSDCVLIYTKLLNTDWYTAGVLDPYNVMV